MPGFNFYMNGVNLKKSNTDNNMMRIKYHDGFTLIELIVVIFLISIVFFYSMPRFQASLFSNNTKKTARWIINNVKVLKEKAAADQRLYTLHLDIAPGRLWTTNEFMREEELENAREKGYELPNDVKLLDVEYPGKGKIALGIADICFYKTGYSDKALIHIEDSDNKQLTFLIEPFLSGVKLFEKYAGFED